MTTSRSDASGSLMPDAVSRLRGIMDAAWDRVERDDEAMRALEATRNRHLAAFRHARDRFHEAMMQHWGQHWGQQ